MLKILTKPSVLFIIVSNLFILAGVFIFGWDVFDVILSMLLRHLL